MVMAQKILEAVVLPLPSSIANSKEVVSQMLSYPRYQFVNNFKSTTPYIPIHCYNFEN